MTRLLRAKMPAPETDDIFTTNESKEKWNQNEIHPLSTTNTNNPATNKNDDFLVLTNPPVSRPAIPPTTSQPKQKQHQKPNPLLEVTTVVLWGLVVLFSVYYVVTEQKRRHRRWRREREEHLEVYSPKKQYNRRMELVKVLKATTMTVRSEDLFYRGDSDEEEDVAPVHHEFLEPSVMDDEEQDGGNGSNCALENTRNDNNPNDDTDDQEEIQQLWCALGQPLDKSSSSWESDEDEHWILQLVSSGQVRVSASCIICLKRFQVGEQVTWSPNSKRNNNQPTCPHAFHQECIIEWLAKLPNCNCPICRCQFCQIASKMG